MRLLLLTLCLLLPACASVTRSDADPYAGGCVAADHGIASKAGAEILAKGGNAVDAAVATSFTLSVVRPYSCGIGGGGFMVIYFSDEGLERQRKLGRTPPRSLALNYREMAPACATPDYYEKLDDKDASTYGGKAIAVPGTVAGLLHALDNYGTLDRAIVLAPAIRAAEDGFAADDHYAAAARELTSMFEEHPEWKQRFEFVWTRFLHEGKVKAGDRIRIPEQAKALRLIADHGTAGFQAGEVGKAIVEAVQKDGGELTVADLVTYRVAESSPLSATLSGRTVLTMPPPSSGGVAMLEGLLIFDRVRPEIPPIEQTPGKSGESFRDAIGRGLNDHLEETFSLEIYRQGPDYIHALTESFKHAFADRARYLADPDFVRVPVEQLLAPANIARMAKQYSRDHSAPIDSYGTPGLESRTHEDHGTSHFSVVDSDGSAVACTETINLEFGSLIAVPEFGFVLNNEMDDFTTRRGQANAFGLTQSDLNLPEPGKRPLSSMTPSILVNRGDVEVVAGASGGPRIISATTQCILGALLNPNSTSAMILARPRSHHQWNPDTLWLERPRTDDPLQLLPHDANELRAETAADLASRGHKVEYRDTIAEVQMIRRRPGGSWDPACDPRKGGKPAGVPR